MHAGATGCEPVQIEDAPSLDSGVCGIEGETRPVSVSTVATLNGCTDSGTEPTEYTGECKDAFETLLADTGCTGQCLQRMLGTDARSVACAAATSESACAAVAAPCDDSASGAVGAGSGHGGGAGGAAARPGGSAADPNGTVTGGAQPDTAGGPSAASRLGSSEAYEQSTGSGAATKTTHLMMIAMVCCALGAIACVA